MTEFPPTPHRPGPGPTHKGPSDGSGFDLPTIGRGLPVADALPDLVRAIRADRRAVVQAPPGTGKTTLIPPALADLVPGRVIVTQPRRIAARAAARRLASLSGTAPGDLVGFSVRGESRGSARTRVEFVTTGVLLRRLLREPDLPGVSAVVLDEVHERHLDTDLVFALVRDLFELRDDLTVVAMSATLDAMLWARLLGAGRGTDPLDAPGHPAPIVAVAGAAHPLAVEWSPAPTGVARLDAYGPTRAFLDHVAATTRAAAAAHQDGSVLVFVPGAREVDHVVARLAGAGLPVLPLSGRLDPAAQDAALAEGAGRRIVVATAVAESSLTVPGVRLVVDSGLSREARFDTVRGIGGLVTVTEARSSADQRAGRAARLGPGTVVRCFAAEDWARMRAFAAPEILTSDLTSFTLEVACWGAPRGAGLALPDAPPEAALDRAEHALRLIGALDGSGAVTPAGERMATVPADPGPARALLDGARAIGPRAAAEAVALLTLDERPAGGDLAALARQVRREGRLGGTWRSEVRRLERYAGSGENGPGAGAGATRNLPGDARIALITALAFPDRLARARAGEPGRYLLASGTGADLPPGSPLIGQEWLAVAALGRGHGTSALIRAAAPVEAGRALEVAEGLFGGATLLEDIETVTWADGRVSGRRSRRLGAIEVSATGFRPSAAQARPVVVRAVAEHGVGPGGAFAWSGRADALRRRLALLHRTLGSPWPDVSDEALLADPEPWLGPEIDRVAAGRPGAGIDLTDALRRLVPWPQAGRLDELAPERITVPSGSAIRVDYPPVDEPDAPPVLAVKLQECFGMSDTPRVAGGRVAVLLHLLSPARRPLAITDDLASFWVHVYPQVRAENRARYAKHPWPADPLTAPPRRGTTRSGH